MRRARKGVPYGVSRKGYCRQSIPPVAARKSRRRGPIREDRTDLVRKARVWV